jgi:AmmeMemoRadiSam system protein A
MAHSDFTSDEKKVLLDLAKSSIEFGLSRRKVMPINLASYSEHLKEERATFVTLEIAHELRGCIGSIKPYRPLIKDVVENAYSAAFQDPRFMPLRQDEFLRVTIHISVLSPMEEMTFQSEDDLIAQLRPNIDGLWLSENGRSATFLPSVWESIESVAEFLRHLKLKAGLPENYWSATLRAFRYTAEYIE